MSAPDAVPPIDRGCHAYPSLCNSVVDQAHGPGPSPELAAPHFPAGEGLFRVLEYFARLMPAGEVRTRHAHTHSQVGSVDRWNALVDEYFTPDGLFRFVLWSEVTHRNRCIGLVRFFSECQRLRLRSMRTHFGETREQCCDPTQPPPPPSYQHAGHIPEPVILNSVTHVVESYQMLQVSTYANGWQNQRVGMFRGLLSPYTRVEYVPAPQEGASEAQEYIPQLVTRLRFNLCSFTTLGQSLYVPVSRLHIQMGTRDIPDSVVEEIIAYGQKRARASSSDANEKSRALKRAKREEAEDEQANESRKGRASATEHTDPPREHSPRQEAASQDGDAGRANGTPRTRFSIPAVGDDPVVYLNQYGVPDPLMETFELENSIAQMQELMDIHLMEGRSPFEILRAYKKERDMDAAKDPFLPEQPGSMPRSRLFDASPDQ
ncbi:hypothetical protein MSPP1_002804 [Malassezia sp. CBS 17886]|nr:hypothetical protein MSPP1_002804 [Malassezia sp. CBS 17886]